MSATKTVPVTITDEAARTIAELGRQKEFDQMLDHARNHVANLRALEIEVAPEYDTDLVPRVVINVWIDEPENIEKDQTSWNLTTWGS